MTIFLSYTDLRSQPSILLKFQTNWKEDMTAKEVISTCMGKDKEQVIENDLIKNNPQIIVSWYHKPTGDVPAIGGVGTLNWKIADNTILTISYESENTTEEQVDESIKWAESQHEFN